MLDKSCSLTEKFVIYPILNLQEPLFFEPGETVCWIKTIWHGIQAEVIGRVIAVFTSVFAIMDAALDAGFAIGACIACLSGRISHFKSKAYHHFQQASWFFGLTMIGSIAGVVWPGIFKQMGYSISSEGEEDSMVSEGEEDGMIKEDAIVAEEDGRINADPLSLGEECCMMIDDADPILSELGVLLTEEDIGKEIQCPSDKPFGIKLWHSPSTGHDPLKISQVPSFITHLQTYAQESTYFLGLVGNGTNYIYVFKAHGKGKGDLVIKLPCSFNESREEEYRFNLRAE